MLNLVRDMKGNKKGFYQYTNSKRKTRENASPLLNEAGEQVTKDTEKAQPLNAFFALDFNEKTCLQQCQLPQTSGTVWSKGRLALSGGALS